MNMRVESMNLNGANISSAGKGRAVASVDEIKSILFLGIKSDIPAVDPNRKVDIII